MGNKVLNTIHYIETTSNYTLPAIDGKQTRVKNTGSSDITVTLPETTTINIAPDAQMDFMYDGTSTTVTGVNSVVLTKGREALQEITTSGLSVDGNYVLAETDIVSANEYSALFAITVSDTGVTQSFLVAVNCYNRGLAKTSEKVNIEILSKAQDQSAIGCVDISLLYGNASTSGYKLLCELSGTTSARITVQLLGNTATTDTGWKLVSATQTGNGNTPDGNVAAGSFSAGGIFDLDGYTSTFVPGFIGRYDGGTIVRCVLDMGEIAKTVPSSTSITLTLPSTFMRFYDGAGNSGEVSVTATTNGKNIGNNKIQFYITEPTNFSGLTANTPLGVMIAGTGGKITIG